MPKAYLASPLGFAESTRGFMSMLEGKIAECGFTVTNPWRLSDPQRFKAATAIVGAEQRERALHQVNMEVAAENEAAIRESGVVVAVLDGADVDSGTASEIGFAYALGKRIYGYRGDFRRTGDNEGSIVNLQVQYWIENSGGRIVRSVSTLQQALEEIGSL
jgi:nucleoside 2-deoxyribosyltransferase